MKNPVLSIIIPVYNAEPFILRCAGSVLDQPYRDIEVLFVDDGSTDNSGKICDELALGDNRVKVIHKNNEGVSSARNTGLKVAAGEYITFVDIDDLIGPDTYQENMKILLADNRIDMLEYPAYIYYGSGYQKLWKSSPVFVDNHIFGYWMESSGYRHAYLWNKIYKSSLLKKIEFPEGKIFEDLYAIISLIDLCKCIYVSDKGLYYYFYNKDSVTQKLSYKKYQDLMNIDLGLVNRFDPQNLPSSFYPLYLDIIDILITLLRFREGDINYNREVKRILSGIPFSVKELLRLPVSWSRKLKNVSLALGGLNLHCFIFVNLYNTVRR